ncbi:MAG: histidine phosphatase family protein [Gemmatimonadales bacterium]|nr:histidine phosphatase family protein [Gemmatimonadales bacterium]
MTTFLLVRHGTTDETGQILSGRRPVHLNAQGRAQAERIPGRLAGAELVAVYSSPLERTVETATPLARALRQPVECLPSLIEVDFGDWTGVEIESLKRQPSWRHFHEFRGGMRIPGGELIAEVAARSVGALAALERVHGDTTVAIVTHADVIRAALAQCLGIPLDLILRLDVDPVSVSVLEFRPWGARLRRLNSQGTWPERE